MTSYAVRLDSIRITNGNKDRLRIPRREKPAEKEKFSARIPIPHGIAPPPIKNPMITTSDSPRPRKEGGKSRGIRVNMQGKRLAAKTAWSRMRMGVSKGARTHPSRSVDKPVAVTKKRVACLCP